MCASKNRQRLSFICAYTSSLKWEERGFCYLEVLIEIIYFLLFISGTEKKKLEDYGYRNPSAF